MSVARLAQIQRDLGLDVVVHGDPGRPGGVAPRVVVAHWTATRATASNPAPTLGMVRNGVGTLPGPLYGDLVDYNGRVHLITIGRHNHAGMGSLAQLDSTAAGRHTPRTPGRDTHGLNGLSVGVSADYHPAQGAPPRAQVEAMRLAIRARLTYHGLPAHAITDHAQLTRRKVDLLTVHWPSPVGWRTQPTPEDEDMPLTDDDIDKIVQRLLYTTLPDPYTGEDLYVATLLRQGGGPTREVRDALGGRNIADDLRRLRRSLRPIGRKLGIPVASPEPVDRIET